MRKQRSDKPLILITISVMLFVIAGFVAGDMWFQKYKVNKDVETIKGISEKFVIELPELGGDEEEEDTDPLHRRIDFDALKEINDDVWGWVYIPDTNIDLYIMKESGPSSIFYLWHSIYGVWDGMGCPLTYDSPNPTIPNAHQVVYAHHFSTGPIMFTELVEYIEKSYADSHPYVYIYHEDRAERYRVWAPQRTTSSNSVYELPFELGSSYYQTMLDNLESNAQYLVGERPSNNTKMMVLSTCQRYFYGSEGRFILPCVPDAVYYYEDGFEMQAEGPDFSLERPKFERPEVTEVTWKDINGRDIYGYKVNDKVYYTMADVEKAIELLEKAFNDKYYGERSDQ